MSRPNTVWRKKNSEWYYTTFQGKQVKLAKDRAEAVRAMHQLLAAEAEPDVVRGRPMFKALANDFLEFSHESNTAGTFDGHRRYLQSFAVLVKSRRAPDLRGEDVTKWFRANPAWGQSTRTLATQSLKACLNYAVTQGRISANPLAKVRHSGMKRRERIVTPEEKALIRKRASGTFKDFLFALEQTGARPFSEIGRLEARFVDWEKGIAELPEHKNRRKGKRRTLYFTPALAAVLKRLAGKHPEGLLFRNRYGNPWDRQAWYKWSKLFERDLGVKGVTAYSYRHAYATEAIMKGVPLPTLAELMGTSVRMLIKNYSHVSQKTDALKEAASDAVK